MPLSLSIFVNVMKKRRIKDLCQDEVYRFYFLPDVVLGEAYYDIPRSSFCRIAQTSRKDLYLKQDGARLNLLLAEGKFQY